MRCAVLVVIVAVASRAADASSPLEVGQRGQRGLKNHPPKKHGAPNIGLYQSAKNEGEAQEANAEKKAKVTPTSDVRYDNMPVHGKKTNAQHMLMAADGSTAKTDAKEAAAAAMQAAKEAKALAEEAATEKERAERVYAEAQSAASQWDDGVSARATSSQQKQQLPEQQQQQQQKQEQPQQQGNESAMDFFAWADAKATAAAAAEDASRISSSSNVSSDDPSQNTTDALAPRVLLTLVGDSILAIKSALKYSSGQRRHIEREMTLLNDANALWATAKSELPGLDGEVAPVVAPPSDAPTSTDENIDYAQGKIADAVAFSRNIYLGLPAEGISEQFRNASKQFQDELEKVQTRFVRVLKERAAEAEEKAVDPDATAAPLPIFDLDNGTQPAANANQAILTTGAKLSPIGAVSAAFKLPSDYEPGFHPAALPSVTSAPDHTAYGVVSRLFASEMELQTQAAAHPDVSQRMAMFFSP